MTGEFQNGQHQIISFNSLREARTIESGTVVTNVKPQELWTNQDWIEVKKVQAALNRKKDADDTYPAEGYTHKHHGKTILVLGDGNTKSIIAWELGKRIEFTVKGELPEGQRATPLSRLRNQYHDLFREFEYS